jgi:hypothetical protein
MASLYERFGLDMATFLNYSINCLNKKPWCSIFVNRNFFGGDAPAEGVGGRRVFFRRMEG